MHLMQAFATADHDFAYGILTQIANAGSQGKDVDEADVDFMLSVIKGIEPEDSDRDHARGSDGHRPHGNDDICKPARPCRKR